MNIKKLLSLTLFAALILILSSCGNTVRVPSKIKTEAKGKVDVDVKDSVVDVNHNINFDISTFKEVCEAEHINVVPQAAKDALIAQCQQERLQELLSLINNLNTPEE